MSSKKKYIPKDLIPIADVVKPKGLKGELKVFLYNKNSKTLKNNINVWIKLDTDKYQLLLVEYLLSSGKYKIINDVFTDKSEIKGKKGDIVVAFADTAPTDEVMGQAIFKVIHQKSKEEIYVSLEDLEES